MGLKKKNWSRGRFIKTKNCNNFTFTQRICIFSMSQFKVWRQKLKKTNMNKTFISNYKDETKEFYYSDNFCWIYPSFCILTVAHFLLYFWIENEFIIYTENHPIEMITDAAWHNMLVPLLLQEEGGALHSMEKWNCSMGLSSIGVGIGRENFNTVWHQNKWMRWIWMSKKEGLEPTLKNEKNINTIW